MKLEKGQRRNRIPDLSGDKQKRIFQESKITGFDIKTIRTDMLREINKERKKAGAKPLNLFETVNKTAQEKAIDMYKIGELNHYSKSPGFFDDQFDRAGIGYYKGYWVQQFIESPEDGNKENNLLREVKEFFS